MAHGNHYPRLNVTMPERFLRRVKEAAAKAGVSVSQYVREAVEARLTSSSKSARSD